MRLEVFDDSSRSPVPPLHLTHVKEETVELTYMSMHDLVERTRVALSLCRCHCFFTKLRKPQERHPTLSSLAKLGLVLLNPFRVSNRPMLTFLTEEEISRWSGGNSEKGLTFFSMNSRRGNNDVLRDLDGRNGLF